MNSAIIEAVVLILEERWDTLLCVVDVDNRDIQQMSVLLQILYILLLNGIGIRQNKFNFKRRKM
jgi:hypothetical protein